jgi:protein-disulfide isomerase
LTVGPGDRARAWRACRRTFFTCLAGGLSLAGASCHRAGDGDQERGPGVASSVPSVPSALDAGPGPRSPGDEYWAHTQQVFNVPVGRSPVLGDSAALVTIVEFSEFQCTSCATMDSMLRDVRAKYGAKVRLVWKNRPLSLQPAAEPAAEAAMEVRAERGNAAFWEMHERLVERTDSLFNGKTTDVDLLVRTAAAAGASAERVRKAIARGSHEEEIEQDRDLAEDFEVEGIPHFFVNGRRLEGVQPRAKLERMIDEEITRAEELLEAGIPPGGLYEALVGRGIGPWAPRQREVPPLPPDDPSIGGANAKVTVHVWSDYQCALCSAVERAMKDLRKDYGDRIHFVWHDLPLARHRQARLFARAAREAYAEKGAPGFWGMHDRIALSPTVPDAADLDRFAASLRLDPARWEAALSDGVDAGAIADDERAAAEAGITETPTFLVVAKNATAGALVGNIEYASKLRRAIDMAMGEGAREREREHEDD